MYIPRFSNEMQVKWSWEQGQVERINPHTPIVLLIKINDTEEEASG